MCRAPLVIALVCAWVTAGLAQDRVELEVRLRRARAEQESLRLQSGRAARQARETMRVGRAGSVVVLLPGTRDGGADAGAVARGVDSTVRELGPVPEEALGRIALVALDGNLRAAAPGIERRVELEFPVPGGRERPTTALVANAADVLVRAIVLRDPAWLAWTQGGVDLGWSRRHAQTTLNDLLTSRWSSGRACVTGDAAACVGWLGISPHEDPVTRFSAADIRDALTESGYVQSPQARDAASRCAGGEDSGCWDWQRSLYDNPGEASHVRDARIRPGTAGGARSLLHYVRERNGPEVLLALLGDSTGTVAERLQRKTGLTPTALAAEWRAWLIARADREPVRAGLAEFFASGLGVGLFLFLATRGGRWRA